MNPPTEAAAAPKGKPKRSNGITTPSRRGGSGRVLTDVIVDLGFVEREAMDEAIEMATSAGSAAERVLVSTGAITEEQLARAVAERFGLDHLDLHVYRVDPDAAKLVTPAAIKRYQAVPVSFAGDRTLLVAITTGGLGVALVATQVSRSLVDLHGGRMEIISREGEGTIVTVTLPLRPLALVSTSAA